MALDNISHEDKLKKLDALRGKLEKEFGKNTLIKLDGSNIEKVPCYSSGILGIDQLLGGGGGKGRIMEVYGPESSGKTTLCLEFIAEEQKKNGICAFVDVEHAFDPSYAKNLGVDVDSLWFSQPDSGEQALSIVEDLVDSGSVSIIVVDSTAALVPEKELEGEIGDSNMGLQARLLSKALRLLTGRVSKNGVLLIFTSQIRMKIGVMFGSPEAVGVGNAMKFYASQRIDIRKGETQTEGEEATANIVRVKVVKNKIAPPFRKGEFIINFGKGFDKIDDLVNQAIKYNVVQKSGSWFSMGDDRLGQGKANVVTFFEENERVRQEVYDKVKAEIQKEIGATAKQETPVKEKKKGKAEKSSEPEMVLDEAPKE